MRTPKFDETVRHLHMAVRHELPFLNRMIEEHGHVDRLIAAFRQAVSNVSDLIHEVHDTAVARHLLQLLGFLTSSVERHTQANGEVPGAGLHTLGLERALVHLGHVAGHVPRDSHSTYFIDNSAPITFTASAHETAYIRIVQHAHHLHGVAVAALRPLPAEHDALVSHAGVEAMQFALCAEERLAMLCEAFVEERNHESASIHDLHLPAYFASYPVAGVMTHGPDPHHLASTLELDLIVGAPGDELRVAHHEHLAHLDHHDREHLENAAHHPSIAMRLLEESGAANDDAHVPPRHLAEHVAQRPWLRESVIAFEALTKAIRANERHLEAIHEIMHMPAHDEPEKLPHHGDRSLQHVIAAAHQHADGVRMAT